MKKKSRSLLVLSLSVWAGLAVASMTGSDSCQSDEKSRVNVWYGPKQTFGRNGNPQRQINILGNIRGLREDERVYYTLNGREEKRYLTIGGDLHRLAMEGDFNIDIGRKELHGGTNIIHLIIERGNRIAESETIRITYFRGRRWPLPYHVDWSETQDVRDAVEIVDGKWEITPAGIRNRDIYYDRIVAFGDHSWVDYEVETSVVFHGYNAPYEGPPTYNVSHVAIATRWPGHDADSLQPDRKWYPLGATSEFRITDQYDSCRWRIFDGEHFYAEQDPSQYRCIKPEKIYRLKHRVETLSDDQTLYSVKFWAAGLPEPEEWDLQAVEPAAVRETGSALLIAHHTEVTFGDISVVPVDSLSAAMQ